MTLRGMLAPIAHMSTVLKSDPVFARYEAAYMTYGVGWMIGYALLPILVTTGLNLDYDQIAESTHAAYWISMVIATFPAGALMDRLGAARSTAISFLALTLYPIGLMLVGNDHQLLLVSVFYGLAHAGANVGWMLGPVSLAPSPAKVPQYVAIHATLVGVRGTIFQGLGIALYQLTGSFIGPLSLAAVAYAWAGVQMWRLNARIGRPPSPRSSPDDAPTPPAAQPPVTS
jgi:MFS family permease